MDVNCFSGSKGKTMPRGPKGEKRPADVIGNAVHVMRVLTGEIEETIPDDGKDPAAMAAGLSETVMDWTDIVEAMDADAPAKKRGHYKKTADEISN
jgi:hypothetical protein